MAEDLYEVWYYGTDVLATGMTLETALIFVEALFNKWHAEPSPCLAIKRMPRTQVEGPET